MFIKDNQGMMHPLEHSIGALSGCYIDIEDKFLQEIKKEHEETLFDNLNNPPFMRERYSPVSTEVNDKTYRGINLSRMLLKAYQEFMNLMKEAALQNRQLIYKMGERKFIPFLGLAIDPATLHRSLEMDYETGTNIYSTYSDLFQSGIIAPTITVPFHIILPSLENEFDLRFCLRTAVQFYMPFLEKYYQYVEKTLKEKTFVAGFWFPECAYNNRVGTIATEEFYREVKTRGIKKAQLYFMFDAGQSKEENKDELIKRVNYISLGKANIWCFFRENYFSNWVCYQNPSIKKVLDKTMAKLNTDKRKNIAQYHWCHFFEFEALIHSKKSAVNFKNIIVKFFETQYLPLAPNEYLRRKLEKRYLSFSYEPFKTAVLDNSSWVSSATWEGDPFGLTRWTGLNTLADGSLCADEKKTISRIQLDEDNNPVMEDKEICIEEEEVEQCWKIALNEVKKEILEFVRGNPEKPDHGVMEILRHYQPNLKFPDAALELFSDYQKIYFKEHFIVHEKKAVELNDLLTRHLNINRSKLPMTDVCILGYALRAYYFTLESFRSSSVHWENFDNQHVYQCSMYLSLSLITLYYVYKYLGWTDHAKKCLDLYHEILVKFENTYERYNLKQYNVTKKVFTDTIKPAIDNAKYNVVARAARKIGARHLSQEDVDWLQKKDGELKSFTDHVWNGELHRANIVWDEPNYCDHLDFD